jgi:diacylglycerol kinase (ATP)
MQIEEAPTSRTPNPQFSPARRAFRLAIPLACFIPVGAVERVLLIGSVLLLLIVELLNSSAEAAIDRIGFDTHRLSKRAKDLGSAAVFLTLVLLATTWGLVAGPTLVSLLRVVVARS